jgi:hypothetical protein
MSAIEPGDEFQIGFGNGHTLFVPALDLRTKNKIAKLMSEAVGSSEAFEKLEQAIVLCCPTITEESWAKIDERNAGEIIGKTLANAALSEDERKKSE